MRPPGRTEPLAWCRHLDSGNGSDDARAECARGTQKTRDFFLARCSTRQRVLSGTSCITSRVRSIPRVRCLNTCNPPARRAGACLRRATMRLSDFVSLKDLSDGNNDWYNVPAPLRRVLELLIKRSMAQEDDAALAKAHMARQGEILEALGSRIGALRRLHEEHVAQAAESHQALSKKVNVASDRHAAGLREVEAKVAGVEAKLAASEERLQSAVDGVEQEVRRAEKAHAAAVAAAEQRVHASVAAAKMEAEDRAAAVAEAAERWRLESDASVAQRLKGVEEAAESRSAALEAELARRVADVARRADAEAARVEAEGARRVAALEGRVAAAEEATDKRLRDLGSHVRGRLRELEAAAGALASAVEQLEGSLAEAHAHASRRADDLEGEVAEVSAACRVALARVEESLSAVRAESQAAVTAATEASAAQLRGELAGAKREVLERAAEMGADVRAAASKQSAAVKDDLAALQAEVAKAASSIAATAPVAAVARDQVRELRATVESLGGDLQEQSSSIAALSKRTERVLSEAKEDLAQATAQARHVADEGTRAVEAFRKESGQEVAAVVAESRAAVQTAKREMEERGQAMEERTSQQLSGIKRDVDAAAEAVRREVTSSIERHGSDLRSEMRTAQASLRETVTASADAKVQGRWSELERRVEGMAGQCAREAQQAALDKINARVEEIVSNWQGVNLSVYKGQIRREMEKLHAALQLETDKRVKAAEGGWRSCGRSLPRKWAAWAACLAPRAFPRSSGRCVRWRARWPPRCDGSTTTWGRGWVPRSTRRRCKSTWRASRPCSTGSAGLWRRTWPGRWTSTRAGSMPSCGRPSGAWRRGCGRRGPSGTD